MRFDEIDLIGELKINGVAGSSGQAIGFSGSNVEWINAASGGSPSTDQLSLSGYNYIIVTATGSAIENGDSLLSAYTQLSSLNVTGGRSEINRLTLFLTPGVYDVSNGDISVISYIDIIGLGGNPLDVRIQGGAASYTIGSEDVDFALENVHLVGDKTWREVGTTSYFRWKNLVIGGDIFGDFSSLNGEFRNIKFLEDVTYAFCADNIDGIYENIEIPNCNTAFRANIGSLNGTFKNIKIGQITIGFFSSNQINGLFENITIENCIQYLFISQGSNIVGTFKNIEVLSGPNSAFYPSGDLGDANSYFENIKINSFVSGVFCSLSGNLNGTYKSITVGSCLNIFKIDSTGYYISDFKIDGLTVGDADEAFISAGGLAGEFKNISLGNIGIDVFISTGGLDGEFKNIKIGSVAGNAFRSSDVILGMYDNITISDVVGNLFFSDSYIDITLKHFECGDIGGSFLSPNTDLLGTYENIKLGSIGVNGFYAAGDSIDATFENIIVESINSRGPFWADSISGYVKNFKSGNIGGFCVVTTYDSNFYVEDVTFGNSFDSCFTGSILLRAKNIKGGNITGSIFVFSSFAEPAIGEQSVEIENLEFGDITGDAFELTGAVSLSFSNMVFRNIKLGNVVGSVFKSPLTGPALSYFSGTIVKDLEVKSAANVFWASVNSTRRILGSRFENITIGTCSTAFKGVIGFGTEIKNLNMTGEFGYSFITGAKLLDSNINISDRNFGPSFSGGMIERSKIVTKAAYPVNLLNVQTYYSMYKYATLNPSSYGTVSNIVDADITF